MQSPQGTLVLGDIHGRSIWKDFTATFPHHAVVFLGDYFDSKTAVAAEQQIDNFNEILAFKTRHPYEVTLLTGNHDYHYFPFASSTFTGYQEAAAPLIGQVLQAAYAAGQLQISCLSGRYLLSHAGFTCTWCRYWNIPFHQPVAAVQALWQAQPEAFNFSPGPAFEPTGNEPEQGPLWVRPESLAVDGLPYFIQVVGHTQQPEINITPKLICIDVLSRMRAALLLHPNGEASVCRV